MDEYPITMDQLYKVSKESTGVYYTHIMQVLSMMGYTGTLCPKEGLHRLILAGEQANKAAPHLDGQYAAFGKIIEGMDIVNKIAEVATDYSDKPLEPQVMKTVTVEE